MNSFLQYDKKSSEPSTIFTFSQIILYIPYTLTGQSLKSCATGLVVLWIFPSVQKETQYRRMEINGHYQLLSSFYRNQGSKISMTCPRL